MLNIDALHPETLLLAGLLILTLITFLRIGLLDRKITKVIDAIELPEEMNEVSASSQSVANADSADDTKIYVGNVDYQASEDELKAHFGRFGAIQMVNIPAHRHTGKKRGFGFVTFDRVKDAEKALALNGTDFRGRNIQVSFAKTK